jgi:heterodisulfide reductase subunit A
MDKVGAVLVDGGGIAGVQAALDLAGSGYYVYLVEKSAAIGGVMSQLDKTFPTNDCSMCILSPKLVECGRHLNIEILTLSEVEDIQGEEGNFKVTVVKNPRYVDEDKCVACGICAEKCPRKVDNPFDEGLGKRKAAYVLYPQAVPLKYAIDKDHCIYFEKGKCRACEKFCENKAINFDQQEQRLMLKVGSIIMAPGFQAFDANLISHYGYARFPNVVTSKEFERILSASGPYQGHLVRPSDQKEPERIAWIQCVGSRNVNQCDHSYCSSVCCMYAIKEAVIAKEHSGHPLDTAIFFMDMRTYGKEFEKYYNRAKEQAGVRFIRSRVHTVVEEPDTRNLLIRYSDETGNVQEESFDMVVLSVGLQISNEVMADAKKLGIELNEHQFCASSSFEPVMTSRSGVYVCGAFQGPKDIPQSVMEASAAASSAGSSLAEVRNTLVREKTYPAERNVVGEEPRIGVFVCNCGINIGSVVKVPEVAKYASTLPNVVFVDENLFSCSQDTQEKMRAIIEEKKLNRVVVASCSPRTHEALFQETCREAAINKYLFEMANIRDQCSWVHHDSPEAATEKAKDLVRMAVAKASLLEPLQETELDLTHSALVIGGGVSGMVAARELSAQGFEVTLVEKGEELGGNARLIRHTWRGENAQGFLQGLIKSVEDDPRITLYLDTQVTEVDGFMGNFKSTLSTGNGTAEKHAVEHGVVIIATGARESRPTEYLFGEDPRVLTAQEFDQLLADGDDRIQGAKTITFIQCVGSREPQRPYCSKVCCTHTCQSATQLKEMDPEKEVMVFYRDIRTYGINETHYKAAREKGVLFFRYDVDHKPQIRLNDRKALELTGMDHVLGIPLTLEPDLLVLAAAIEPHDNHQLAQLYKVPLNDDGFFLEAHMKLRPVDFATDGVFLAGLAHYPKPLDESIAQAKAAVGRAATVLATRKIQVGGTVAYADPTKCAGCGVCELVCAYKAISLNPETLSAEVNEALCKGCGTCVSSCRSSALSLKGFNDPQIFSMIDALSAEVR